VPTVLAFAPHQGQWVKIEQLGAVRIGDDVEIGANTCIDRGALDDTVIEDGVKLDNLIQIGHNVRIGAHTAMAGNAGVAGSATIGAHCTVGGGAIVLGHLTLADKVHISAATVVTRSIREAGPLHRHVSHRRQCELGKKRRFPQATQPPARAPQGRRAGSRTSRQQEDRAMMDIHQILKQLPHRYPFLLVDRVLELEKGKRIKALKNVTINEPFFTGHFPHRPVMPGVLMLEAMAQAAALLAFDMIGSAPDDKTVYYFAGIDGCPLQATGGAGRPADHGRVARAHEGGHLQVQGVATGRRRRVRGRADVHHAHHRLNHGPQRMSSIHPTALVDPRPSWTARSASALTPSSVRT
jgi:beta-hydroxyacyl-ACP dehydratase FabZ